MCGQKTSTTVRIALLSFSLQAPATPNIQLTLKLAEGFGKVAVWVKRILGTWGGASAIVPTRGLLRLSCVVAWMLLFEMHRGFTTVGQSSSCT